MVLHNPNNWHWVSKNALDWTKQWLEDKLLKLSAEQGNVTARLDKVVSLDGDVDVNQRKGKVITIYDFKLALEFSGKSGDVEASGSVTIPEVSHDTAENEYVFDIDVFSDADDKRPVKDLVRSALVPKLRTELGKLSAALIHEHGKDIQHTGDSNPSSRVATPKPHAPQSSTSQHKLSASAATQQSVTATGGSGSKVSTLTVTDTEEFRTTAEELYNTLTDPGRLAAFTQSPPKRFDGAKVGGKFELFGGNVSGEYVVLERPTKITQLWRLDQWPANHYSKLQIVLDQNDADHVTVMRVTWTGVPVGQDEVTKRNWGEYYVRSIKRTFGFGSIL